MDRLIFVCGNYHRASIVACSLRCDDRINVLGSKTNTPKEMYSLGYNLRLPRPADEDAVFSNDKDVLLGLRMAIVEELIDFKHIIFKFYPDDGDMEITSFNELGNFLVTPKGFFHYHNEMLLQLRMRQDILKLNQTK